MTEQRKYEDRGLVYHEWHRPPNLPTNWLMCDIDCVEYAKTSKGSRPVCFYEVTRTNREFADLGGIWQRLDPDGKGSGKLQTEMMRWMGARLRIPTFVVVFNEQCDRFAVRNLMPPSEWRMLTEAQYRQLLHNMRAGAREQA